MVTVLANRASYMTNVLGKLFLVKTHDDSTRDRDSKYTVVSP
jgi:hypothetical protein